MNLSSGTIRRVALSAALIGVVAAPSAAPGQGNRPKPPKGSPAITIESRTPAIVFGQAATLSGRLSDTASDRDVLVRLEADDTLPFGDAYAPTGATTRTSPNGGYSFDVRPVRNTQYRVTAESSPPVTSAGRVVSVHMRVGLVLSDSTPRRGQRVRFSGSVSPAHDGRTALIQRRGSTGRWVTVARATLRDAGTARSRYVRRLRIRRDGVYRVRVAADADHLEGISRERTADVGG